MALRLRVDLIALSYVLVIVTFEELVLSNKLAAETAYVKELNNASDIPYENIRDIDVGFTIRNSGCTIPAMDILDQSMRSLIHNPTNIPSCHNSRNPLLGNNQTHIWIRSENFRYYHINHKSHVECCYKAFYRPVFTSGVNLKVDDRVKYIDCVMFREIIEASNEFVKVLCSYKNRMIYDQFFIFAPKKTFTLNRENPFVLSQDKLAYNVIIMGLSSISRLNFHRTMPNTFNLLKEMEAVELLGYNTVADNTLKNVIPMLVGMNNSELKNTCWPNAKATFDSCPFIWERFKDVGYYTALLEDTTRSGIFNTGVFGFSGSPTDYYLHPFIHESEIVHQKLINNRRKSPKRKTQEKSTVCMDNRYYFRVILDYVDSLTKTLKSSKLFALFWESSMSHELLNAPMTMDHGYEMLLRKLDESEYLNDTVLILLSDHGMNYGDIRLTKQGRFEERLPFISVLTPPSFRENYNLASENLKMNSRRLTTAFDVHQTLIDLIDLNAVNDDEILLRSKKAYAHQRGISLFLPIPSNRTCNAAGISSHWCTCHKKINLSFNSTLVREARKFLIKHMNGVLKFQPQCARLAIDNTIEAIELKPSYAKENQWREFMIVVQTTPGAGVFEATMRRDSSGWSLSGPISRLNLHGGGDQNCCVYQV